MKNFLDLNIESLSLRFVFLINSFMNLLLNNAIMKKLTVSLFILQFILSCSLISQTITQKTVVKKYMIVKNAPGYVLQINGLYSMSALNLGGAYNSDFQSALVKSGENLGTRNGLGASIVSKISISGDSRLWFVQSLSFNLIQSYLLAGTKLNSDNGKAKYNCYTGGLGFEYNITPNYSTKVFAGAEINASMINGSMDIWMPVASQPYNTENFKVSNSFRMGYSISTGASFMLSKQLGLNLVAKYSCLNALFRSAEGTNTDTEFTLRDGNSTEPLLFSGIKIFSFFSVGAGVSIYFGVIEKKYKLN